MSRLHELFLQTVSGKRRGPAAALLRAGLAVLSVLYGLMCRARLLLYRIGLRKQHRLGAPVVCVGNITTGGTGKTPMVIWLGRWLQERGIPAAILSRGYGERAPEAGAESDEMLIFRQHLPDVPHLVGPKRVETGARAVADHGARCIVLDDGFQHLAVARDLDVVLIDSLMPFGFGHLLPRGLLREPLSALRRAGIVVLTRADLAPDAHREAIRERVRAVAGDVPVAEACHRPVCLTPHGGGEPRPLDWARGRRLYGFSALGNPEAFPRTLASLGAEVVQHDVFRDHHWYTPSDLETVSSQAAALGAEAAVTTEKDAVKIENYPADAPPLYVLTVEFTFLEGEERLTAGLERVLAAARAGR
jgi:tetraacyldisaccharide 4'-kinase